MTPLHRTRPRAALARARCRSPPRLLVVVPVSALLCRAEGSALHLSDYWRGAGRQDHVLRDRRAWRWTWCGAMPESCRSGHGLFFALGGYAMGMYLMREIGARRRLPQRTCPTSWCSSTGRRFPGTGAAANTSCGRRCSWSLVPGLLACVFGFFAFRSRIKGVYFSIITQALTYAAMLLFFRNETGFGGNNGFTDFKRILGFPIATPRRRASALFAASAARCSAPCCSRAVIVTSKFGRVLTAIRDAERASCSAATTRCTTSSSSGRCRRCCAASPARCTCRRSGIINPSEMSPANSIEIAIWVAVGGRGTLVGALRRRRAGERRQELVHRGVSRSLAVLPRAAVHPGDPVPAAGRGRRCCGSLRRHKPDGRGMTHHGLHDGAGRNRPPSGEAAFGRIASGGAGHHPRGHSLSRRHQRQLRRLQGAQQAVAQHRRRASCAASSAQTAPARPR